MRRGAAERLHVDVLPGDRADHVRSGDEIRASGTMTTTSVSAARRPLPWRPGRARPTAAAPVRRPGSSPRTRRRGAERPDALGQPHATGVLQPDHWARPGHGQFDSGDEVTAALGAHHPGVGGVGDHGDAVDRAGDGEHAAIVGVVDRLESAVQQLGQAQAGIGPGGDPRGGGAMLTTPPAGSPGRAPNAGTRPGACGVGYSNNDHRREQQAGQVAQPVAGLQCGEGGEADLQEGLVRPDPARELGRTAQDHSACALTSVFS